MTSRPKVSYVVASYNHEAFAGDLLHSILAQTYADLELVVVDDGSSDDTPKIAREIASTDPRMRVYVQENMGVVNARNRGVMLTHGEYVSIVDSDDLLPQERTRWQVEALDAEPNASLVYGDAWIIDRDGKRIARRFQVYPPVPGNFSAELLANYCFVPAITVMFRRSAFEKSGPFWGPGPNTDYLKWIELGLFGEAICLLDRQLGYWRQHGNNVSGGDAEERIRQYEDLCRALQRLVQLHPELGRQIGERRLRWRYGRCHFMGAFYAGLEHSWDLARTHFRAAYHLNPSFLNASAWFSTLPGINLISTPFYQLARQVRKL